ncbi:hypothetical protein [uncultured Acetatifactor sp.]|uniref:coiled-coil domain-containing protein n=1 Tax=uncultured Acetatifactor sp. TaxID=1671927 RepID=UPI002626AE51|nr:hypothetical protein [uncultured Acetatifactor sp.]
MTDTEKLDLILSEMQGMKTEIADMKGEITDMKGEIADMKGEITDMKGEITDMKGEIADMKGEITDMKGEITDIRQKVTKTDLTIENEIRVNIQRVAEGHLDLSRKLNECIRLSSDIKDKQEIQDIFINMHNSKLKAL